MTLIYGAILGFISVAFGAYAEHGLKPIITEENFRFLLTAIRYNQVHAVVITVIGLFFLSNDNHLALTSLRRTSFLFITGTIIFCFSIYISVTLNLPGFLYGTPFGGVIIMLGWLMLLIAGVEAKKEKTKKETDQNII